MYASLASPYKFIFYCVHAYYNKQEHMKPTIVNVCSSALHMLLKKIILGRSP